MSELKAFELFGNRNGEAIGIDKQNKTLNLDYKEVYLKYEADKVIAEKDKTIVELKDKLQNVSELLKETREWLIESQKMHQRCADNASKQIRRLKRALWLARAERAKTEHLSKIMYSTLYRDFIAKWVNVERKCRAKAEGYK